MKNDNLSKQVEELNRNFKTFLQKKSENSGAGTSNVKIQSTQFSNKPFSGKRTMDHYVHRRAKSSKTDKDAIETDPIDLDESSDDGMVSESSFVMGENTGVKPNLKTNNTNQQKEDKDSWAYIASTSFKRAVKPTPIQLGTCLNNDFGKLFGLLKEHFAANDFEWIHLKNTAKPRIVCSNEDIKNKIITALKENNCEFNTYADKNTKRSSYIVRGLHYEHDADNINAIRDSLLEFGVSGAESVVRFLTPIMKRMENPAKLYQIVFNAEANIDNLNQIKCIDNFRVRIEKQIGSKTTQCRRCQRFTHVASSCHFKYRCVQCTATHGPGNCPRAINNKLPIGCVNCLDGGFRHNDHTANDLVHCHFFPKISC